LPLSTHPFMNFCYSASNTSYTSANNACTAKGFDSLAVWRSSDEWNAVKSAGAAAPYSAMGASEFKGILIGLKKNGSGLRFIDGSVTGPISSFFTAQCKPATPNNCASGGVGDCLVIVGIQKLDDRNCATGGGGNAHIGYICGLQCTSAALT